MPKIKFSDLDSAEKRAAFWLADEAETLTPTIIAAATHIGELWEAEALMKEFPKGTAAHTTLAHRLRLGDTSAENILDCIRRAAPAYCTLGERIVIELDDLPPGLESASASL